MLRQHIIKQGETLRVVNLSPLPITPAQRDQGVVDLHPTLREELLRLHTFDEKPDSHTLVERAMQIGMLLKAQYKTPDAQLHGVLLGGEPFFLWYLEDEMFELDLHAVYAWRDELIFPHGWVEYV